MIDRAAEAVKKFFFALALLQPTAVMSMSTVAGYFCQNWMPDTMGVKYLLKEQFIIFILSCIVLSSTMASFGNFCPNSI